MVKGNGCIEKLLNLNSKQTEVLNNLLKICEIDVNRLLCEQKPYMTWKELKELADNGWIIGSHGTNHFEFQQLTENERMEQLFSSFRNIEEHVPVEIRMFAFPFTDAGIGGDFIKAIHLKGLVDVSFGGAGIYKERINGHVQRIPMEKEYASSAEAMIKTEYFYYFAKSLVGKKFVTR